MMAGNPDRQASKRRDEADYEIARDSQGATHETTDIHKLLVDSVRDYAIFALDATGHVLTWNAGAERLKGYAPHEIIGKHFSTFYPEEAKATGFPQYELEVASEVGRFEDEGWRIRKDGSSFWANVVITALRNDAGQVIGFAKVTRDLTERKQAEEELRQSEERMRTLVVSVRDYGIFMLDPTGHIASWNEGAERIKGYTEEEIIGKHFSVFYPQEDLDNGKPEMELREAMRVGRFEDEGWRLRKDGTPFWANVVITALRNTEGKLIGFAKVTRDLTERRAAEQRALEDARRVSIAEAANHAKSEFLAAMSHELRTPLNAIGGYAELIALGIHGPINDAQAEALNRIRTSQQHLLRLITDLLNFSKIEAGSINYELGPVSVSEMLDTVLPMIEPQAFARGMTMEWPASDETIVLWADKPKVEQIMLNLLTNAVKYTQPGGIVGVRYYEEGDRVAVEVRDTGVGIPADQLGVIFEPFVQVGRTLTSAQEGAGLGLAISRDLARAMNGDLTVTSELEKGSVFTLYLPKPPSDA